MKKIILITIFLLMISSVSAIDIAFYFKEGAPLDLKIACINNDNSYCASTTNCSITIHDPDNINIVSNQNMSFNPSFYNYTIPPENIRKKGEYSAEMNCVGANVGFKNFKFVINTEGTRLNTSVFIIAILIGVYAIIIFGFIREDPHIVTIGSFIMMAIGIYIAIYGMGDIDNFIVNAFALINIGISGYIILRTGIEMMDF